MAFKNVFGGFNLQQWRCDLKNGWQMPSDAAQELIAEYLRAIDALDGLYDHATDLTPDHDHPAMVNARGVLDGDPS